MSTILATFGLLQPPVRQNHPTWILDLPSRFATNRVLKSTNDSRSPFFPDINTRSPKTLGRVGEICRWAVNAEKSAMNLWSQDALDVRISACSEGVLTAKRTRCFYLWTLRTPTKTPLLFRHGMPRTIALSSRRLTCALSCCLLFLCPSFANLPRRYPAE